MKYGFLGNGDLSKQIAGLLNVSNGSEAIYFDDFHEIDNVRNFAFGDWVNTEFSNHHFIIGLGYKNLVYKNEVIKEAINLGRQMVTSVHTASFVSKSAKIGKGVFIYPMSNIDKGVIINDGVIINNSVVVSHDSEIGPCSYLSPGTIVSGNVKIGENCFIGSGSVIANNVTIGNNVRIGLGSVVASDLPDDANAIGNPLRILNRTLQIK